MDMEEWFRHPPRSFSPAPLWFWYGNLDEREIERQIDEMVDKHVFNAFMHARAYLVTPYLEEPWWQIVRAAVRHGRETGFCPWIYDEYAWPSGTAGSIFRYGTQKPSRVLAKGETNMAKGLRMHECDLSEIREGQLPFLEEKSRPAYAFRMRLHADGRICADTLQPVELGRALPAQPGVWKVMAFYRYVVPTCVDYLNPSAIRDFIRFTHEEYKKRFGDAFSHIIPGVFFDEIYNAGSPVVWSDSFAAEFKRRKHYDITSYLPMLIRNADRMAEQVRGDYFEVLSALYEKAFFAQLSDWCRQNGLMLTGHTEEWIAEHPLRQGNYFTTMRHLQIPGADCHDYRYKYPRRISPTEPKDAVSVARLYAKPRCMSESMGGGGWATSLQEFKRGIHVLAAMGINMFILHGFYYENEHQGSQSDWPTSFFFQNPYWEYFRQFADYISRLSLVGASGKPVVDVGIYYPIREMWQGYANGAPTPAAGRMAAAYAAAMDTCVHHQIDADWVDEDSILRGTVHDGRLEIGDERFAVLLLPDCLNPSENLRKRLEQIRSAGVRLLFYTAWDGTRPPAGRRIFTGEPTVYDAADLPEAVRALCPADILVRRGDAAEFYGNHRRIDGRDIYFLANGRGLAKTVSVRFRCGGVPWRYDIESGARRPLTRWKTAGAFTDAELIFEPDEAFYLVFEPGASTGLNTASLPNSRVLETLEPDTAWSSVPMANAFDTQWGIGDAQTELEIPVARFYSESIPDGEWIRLCNRAGEPGRCGRHLSNWKAFWITRRPGWYDDSCRRLLYFRRKLFLSAAPTEARLCVAPAGRFTLFVNGRPAGAGSGWANPATLDVRKFLHAGENLLAVRLDNPDHIDGRDVMESDRLPPEGLTSLLMQGTCRTPAGQVDIVTDSRWIVQDEETEGWNDLSVDAESGARTLDVTQMPNLDIVRGQWLHAYERGRPPLQPWGQLPLFGRLPGFPTTVEYRVQLPVGACRLYRPEIRGAYTLDVDGHTYDEASFADGAADLPDPAKGCLLRIRVRVSEFSDGLMQNIRVRMRERPAPLGDWCRQGLDWYSGRMRYRSTFTVSPRSGCRYVLDMGRVNFHAEVWVNGRLAGVRIWEPYRLDVTDLLRQGRNEICVIVSNLAANRKRYNLVDEGRALAWNRYWNEDNIQRDKQNLCAGLFGPVRLLCLAE